MYILVILDFEDSKRKFKVECKISIKEQYLERVVKEMEFSDGIEKRFVKILFSSNGKLKKWRNMYIGLNTIGKEFMKLFDGNKSSIRRFVLTKIGSWDFWKDVEEYVGEMRTYQEKVKGWNKNKNKGMK